MSKLFTVKRILKAYTFIQKKGKMRKSRRMPENPLKI